MIIKNTLNFTHRTSCVELYAVYAPKDSNGNTRYDISVTINGIEYRDTLPSFRKVKAGYRAQLASYGSLAVIFDKIQEVIIQKLDERDLPKHSSGPRRSNSSEAVKLIGEHIKECLSTDETEVLSEQLESVCKAFHSWYGPHERRVTKNLQDAFQEWLMGLPAELSVEFYYNMQADKLNDWMGATAIDYSNESIVKRYCAIIFREFNKMCKAENVPTLFVSKRK